MHSREYVYQRAERLERDRIERAAPPKEEGESEEVRKLKAKLATAEQEKANAEREKADVEETNRLLEEKIKAMEQVNTMTDKKDKQIAQLADEISDDETDQASQEKIATGLPDKLVSNEFKEARPNSAAAGMSPEHFGRSRHTLHGRVSPIELQVGNHSVVVEVENGNNDGNVVSSGTDETVSYILH